MQIALRFVMNARADFRTALAVTLVAALALLACKRRRTSSQSPPAVTTNPATTAASSASAPEIEYWPETVPEREIDASHVADEELCVKPGQQPHAMANQPAREIVASMRSALRSTRSIYVHGIMKTEIPKIDSFLFQVRASRGKGLVFDANDGERQKPERVSIVQLPGGKTYASGAYLFSGHPELKGKIGDDWFEVPESLLTASAGDAHPDGPQGFFGMDIGYKAAIASWVQQALAWYPDEQAQWLFKPRRVAKTPPETQPKELRTIDRQHGFFAGCQTVSIVRGGLNLEVSASSMPLPLQFGPMPGTITGRYRWGDYNEPFRKEPKAPTRAVTLAALVAGK